MVYHGIEIKVGHQVRTSKGNFATITGIDDTVPHLPQIVLDGDTEHPVTLGDIWPIGGPNPWCAWTRQEFLDSIAPKPWTDLEILARMKRERIGVGKTKAEKAERLASARSELEQFDKDRLARSQRITNGWLARGDGIAIYEDKAMDSDKLGHHIHMSFGSPAAQIETPDPPFRMPDTGRFGVPWAYQLVGTYRGEAL